MVKGIVPDVLRIPGNPQHMLVAEGLEVLRERRHRALECDDSSSLWISSPRVFKWTSEEKEIGDKPPQSKIGRSECIGQATYL
jgi:hypothetical protein